MAELHATIEIDAPAERVWQVLMDCTDFPRWNPFIRYVTGELAVGTPLGVHLSLQDGRIRLLTGQVSVFLPGREVRWSGRLDRPKGLALEHALRIDPLDERSVRFTQRINTRGALAPFLVAPIQKKLQRGLVEMNQAMKEELEGDLPPERWFRSEPIGNPSRQE